MTFKYTKSLAILLVGFGGLVSASAQQSVTYSYDELGRLIKTEYGAAGAEGIVNYELDPAGNRNSVVTTTSPIGEDPNPPSPNSYCAITVPLDGYIQIVC